MTIYLYTGTPGSSKSLHAASDARFALSRRYPQPVLGNFELAENAPIRHPELYFYKPNSELTVSWLTDFATSYWETYEYGFREDWLILIIDECQLLFNSRRWNSKDRLAWLEFLSQHRKYGYKIILIAQSAKMIDNQFRMLVEYEINHRRCSSMGIIGSILGFCTRNLMFFQVRILFPTSERLGASVYLARKRDMQMYDTHKTFEKLLNT